MCRCSAACTSGSKLFHADPLMVGAFPGSAVHAHDLLQNLPDREPVWFDLALLEYARVDRKNNARVAITSFTQTICELHQSSGEPMQHAETVRKQFGKTLEEYETILYMRDERVSKLAEGDSLIACCAACSGLRESVGMIFPTSNFFRDLPLQNLQIGLLQNHFALP